MLTPYTRLGSNDKSKQMSSRWIPIFATLAALCVGCGSSDDHSASAADVKPSNQKVSPTIDRASGPDSAKQQVKTNVAGGAGATSPGTVAPEGSANASGQKIPDAGRHF